MKLFTLLYGKSKKRMKPIMVDTKHQCEKYMKARMATRNVEGWHDIIPAEKDSKPWKQKTASVGGKYGGWIGKNGYNPHT